MTRPEDPSDLNGPAADPEQATTLAAAASEPPPDRTEEAGTGDSDPQTEDAPVEQDSRLRSTVEWIAVLVGAVVIALLVRTFLFTTFWIPTGSMEPTLQGKPRSDRVIVNRLSYRLGDIERGDIVVFEVPPGEPITSVDGQQVKELIKRVVGLPGETVELRDGDVYIDGRLLEEPYLVEGTPTLPCPGVEVSRFEVPDGAVFVMGDNRTASRDARCWRVHSVETDAIVGRAFVRIWPISEFGGL